MDNYAVFKENIYGKKLMGKFKTIEDCKNFIEFQCKYRPPIYGLEYFVIEDIKKEGY